MSVFARLICGLAILLLHCWNPLGVNGQDIPSLQTNFDHVFRTSSNSTKDLVKTSECGGALEGPNGQVSYKVGESLSSFETCVWVLRTPNSTDYSVAIFNMGFTNPSQLGQLILSCAAFGTPLVNTVPSDVGLYTLNNCTVLIITLTTDNVVSPEPTGFSLQFAGFHNGLIRSPSKSSKDFVLDGKAGYLRYPTVGYISSWELSSFVFLPSGPAEGVDVVYIRNQLEESYDNFLTIYMLNRSSTDPWVSANKIYYDMETAILSNQEAILIIFENTYEGYYNKGFHFITKCPKEVEIPTSTGTNYPSLETNSPETTRTTWYYEETSTYWDRANKAN